MKYIYSYIQYLASFSAVLACITFTASAQLSNTIDGHGLKAKKSKKWSVLSILQAEHNFSQGDGPDRQTNSTLLVSPSYQLSQGLKVSATLAYLQSFDDEQKSEINNLKIGLIKAPQPLLIKKPLKWSQSAFIRLPTNQKSREVESFQGAISYEPKLHYEVRVATFRFPLSYGVLLQKNIHRFSQSENASANISHYLRHRGSLEVALIGSALSLGVDFSYENAWTYRETPRSSFGLSEFFAYQFSPQSFIQIGHSNQGAALKANGVTNNVSLFDKYRSTYFGSIIFIY